MLILVALIALGVLVRLGWHRLASAPPRPRVFPPEIGLGMVLAMFLAGYLGVRGIRWALGVPDAPEGGTGSLDLAGQARDALGAYVGQGLVALFFLVRCAATRPPVPDLRPSHARAGTAAAAAILLCWPLASAAGWLAAVVGVALGAEPPDPLAHETLRLLSGESPGPWVLVMVGLVVVAAPVLEEVTYRGLLQNALRRVGLGPWPAVVLTSAFFALMHVGAAAPHAVVALFVLSLFFGAAYERTGRLTAPIVMHAIFNLGNLAVARGLEG